MSDADNSTWERTLILQVATEHMKEKRRKRRWQLFFRFMFLFIILGSFLVTFINYNRDEMLRGKAHTALIDVEGAIFAKSDASAEDIATGLREAYKDKGTKGIILRINSPGGSPVQASFAYNEIKRQRALHPNIPVYAACTDMCASAAYFIAASADKIYADPSSLVGSIGVIYNGFGFTQAMDKLGVERRLVTAGVNKGFMDPFSPMSPSQKDTLSIMLNNIHQEFIAKVKEGRGARLKDDPNLFSGLFWTGRQAKDLGLIDDFKSPGQIAREIIKQEKVIDYTNNGNFIDRIGKKFSDELHFQLTGLLNSDQSLR